VFSPDPDGAQPWNLDTMTHRYERYAAAIRITSSLKELRHYSATQLLSSDVDLRTMAGRLGHTEGSTTLPFYAQFVRPADQHAASVLSSQLAALRKKEALRVLFEQQSSVPDDAGLAAMAESLAPSVGLNVETACGHSANSPVRCVISPLASRRMSMLAKAGQEQPDVGIFRRERPEPTS
jgi:hypothetical protein